MDKIRENKKGVIALVVIVVGVIIGFNGSWFGVFVAIIGMAIACYDWYQGMQKENVDFKTYLPISIKQKLFTVIAIALAVIFLLSSAEIISVAKADKAIDEAWDEFDESWAEVDTALAEMDDIYDQIENWGY